MLLMLNSLYVQMQMLATLLALACTLWIKAIHLKPDVAPITELTLASQTMNCFLFRRASFILTAGRNQALISPF